MPVKIITDSVSDLPKYIVEKFDITVIPLTVNFEDESYRDGIDITNEEFFSKLQKTKKLPTTSQVTPGKFIEALENVMELNGNDEVVVITMSSSLSGTYSSALAAKDALGSDRIHIVDSRNVSFALGMLVIRSASLAMKGATAVEIVKDIEARIINQRTYVLFDTTDYLAKGGRLSAGKAIASKILNIKPILEIKDGRLVPIDKVRSKKKFVKWVFDYLENHGISLQNKPVGIFCATHPEERKELVSELEKYYNFSKVYESEVGSVVGTYSGPGCIAITFNLLD